MARFDEIELRGTTSPSEPERKTDSDPREGAGIGRRVIAFTIDLSLFIAAAVAMSPLVPEGTGSWSARFSVVGFLLLISLYYLGLAWTIWGKTIGGAIADVRVVSEQREDVDISQSARRWAGTILSLLTVGAGFIPALFGRRRSLADRLSGTKVVAGSPL